MAINIWPECLEADAQDYILSTWDNTSVVGWLHSSSCFKLAAHEAHVVVVRHVALLVLNVDCCLASQHIQEDLNTVADLLSFSGGIIRARRKKKNIAKISQLPSEISSSVLSVLQIAA